MNARRFLTWAAIFAAGSLCVPTGLAQGLLDQQLGDKPPAPPPAAPAPTDSPKTLPPAADSAGPPADHATDPKPAAAPGGADIISPDAVRTIDDQDLINKLTNPKQGQPPQQKPAQDMQSMLDRMGQSAKLLDNKDPGNVTQETQRRILVDLDELIAIAQQQQQSSGSSQGPPQPGQQRQSSQAQGGMGQGGSQAATDAHPETSGDSDAAAGDMRNHDPASWGALPPRDRDAISHGANEEYLSAYRDLIDRYYQALAELGKSGGR